MDVNKENWIELTLLQRALDLPILGNEMKISGSLYISSGLEKFATVFQLRTRREVLDFENETGTYLVAELGDVELVQVEGWEEKR